MSWAPAVERAEAGVVYVYVKARTGAAGRVSMAVWVLVVKLMQVALVAAVHTV